MLKPDIAAPGVNILAQGFTEGVTGEARHLGYGQASGTSMAAPHVAGAASLLQQIHPTWSPAWIKSALMSTSKYTDIYVDTARTIRAEPLDMGAGRLDLTNAADPGVILDPPSLSFGRVVSGTIATQYFNITSVASTAETYTAGTHDVSLGYDPVVAVAGMTVSPASVTLAPGQTAQIRVDWNPALAGDYGDQQGYLVLTGSSHKAHLPAWMRVAFEAPPPADVLVIDNDASSSLGGASIPQLHRLLHAHPRGIGPELCGAGC